MVSKKIKVPTDHLVVDYKFEVALAVADYLKDDEDKAFDLATNDQAGAKKLARSDVKELCGKSAARSVKIVDCEFVECDSSNPHHAGAIYLITVRGPAKVIKAIRDGYEG